MYISFENLLTEEPMETESRLESSFPEKVFIYMPYIFVGLFTINNLYYSFL